MFSGGDRIAAATKRLVEATRGTQEPELMAGAHDVETAVLSMRLANWRFLATSDPKGPATFRSNVEKLDAAIAALEKAIAALEKPASAAQLSAAIAPVRAAMKDCVASFESLAAAMLQADDLFENVIRVTNIKIDEQQEGLRQALASLLAKTKAETGTSSRPRPWGRRSWRQSPSCSASRWRSSSAAASSRRSPA